MGRTLTRVLRHAPLTLAILLATDRAECLPVHPGAEGIFPDAGQRAHDGRRFKAIRTLRFRPWNAILQQMVAVVDADPAVDTVNGFTGGSRGGATIRRACSSS